MGYAPSFVADAGDLIGNATAATAQPENIPLDATISMSGSVLASLPPSGSPTTGDHTIASGDWEKSLVTTDTSGVNYTLPAGLPSGLKVRSYQGASGQISYIAGAGATIINGTPKSGGLWSAGYFADLENLGGDVWIVTGKLA